MRKVSRQSELILSGYIWRGRFTCKRKDIAFMANLWKRTCIACLYIFFELYLFLGVVCKISLVLFSWMYWILFRKGEIYLYQWVWYQMVVKAISISIISLFIKESINYLHRHFDNLVPLRLRYWLSSDLAHNRKGNSTSLSLTLIPELVITYSFICLLKM